jgi:hypothetical protein
MEITDLNSRGESRDPDPVWGNRHNFLFYLREKKVLSMKETEDNYLGAEKPPYYQLQNNGVALFNYTPLDIAKIAKSVIENPKVPEDIRKRITDLNNSIDESDNPVLLIGRIKR